VKLKYSAIEIFTDEEARYHGAAFHEEIVRYILGL